MPKVSCFDSNRFARCGAGFAVLASGLLAIVALTPGNPVDAQQVRARQSDGRELIELPAQVQRPATLNAIMAPVDATGWTTSTDGTSSRGVCPPVTTTHSSIDFDGTNVTVGIQAGFVAEEVAAASYTIDPVEFPVVIRTTDFIIARESTGGEVTTEWSWLVWEGTPDTGTLVALFSSDGTILPHATMQANEQALNIQVTVDPSDPEQIVVEDNGSHTFTIGYRIDVMNDPPTSPCGFDSPAPCCPHDTQSNAFPTTDTINPDSADVRTGNWLFCRPGCGTFACPGGWHRFDQLGLFEPGGDWNIRVKYEPFDCSDPTGACCFDDGSACTDGLQSDCLNAGGTFQGEATTCAQITCPDPVGACCFYESGMNQCVVETQAECATRHDPGNNMYATWSGAGTQCTDPPSPICSDESGACCFTDGSCVETTFFNCGIAGGEFRGVTTNCVNLVCNPQGACCMPDGSCMEDVPEDDCLSSGGTFQGDSVACSSVNCPQPTGACCLSNGACIIEPQANCLQFPGASWAGANTDCSDVDGNGTADSCEAGTPCPADLTGDDTVDVFDLFALLNNWGTSGAGADLAQPDNVVDVFDLFELLNGWGSCP